MDNYFYLSLFWHLKYDKVYLVKDCLKTDKDFLSVFFISQVKVFDMSLDNTIENNMMTKLNSENVEDNNNILEDKKQKRLNNLKPWKPFTELSPEEREEQRKIASLGGKARTEQINRRKTMKESAQILLSQTVSTEYAQKILGENADISGIETMQDLITAKMLREILENGNAKAFELVRDTSGNKPTAELEVRADVVTASDRALIDKVADRLGLVNITDEDETESR